MSNQNSSNTEESTDFSVPLHQSLLRPMLLLGCERELILMLAILCGIFIISLAQLWAAITGVVLWLVGAFLLSRAASFDPQLSKTFFKSVRMAKLYKSGSTPFAEPSKR